jgi:RNA polymerase sigma-70 factor, ECF subfamily
MASLPDITTLLDDRSRENHRALEQLLPLVYEELRYVARRQLRRERAGHTLQPTALVHEAYLRLVDQRQVSWRSRAHFFGVAAQVMRRILVDDARRHNAAKWGDGIQRVPIDDAIETRIVELRAFGGRTIEEAAHVLNVSSSTAKREWRTAKAWLTRELRAENHP